MLGRLVCYWLSVGTTNTIQLFEEILCDTFLWIYHKTSFSAQFPDKYWMWGGAESWRDIW